MVIKQKLIQDVDIIDAKEEFLGPIKLTFIAEMKNVLNSIGHMTPMRKVEDRKTRFDNPVYFDVYSDKIEGKLFSSSDIEHVNLDVNLHINAGDAEHLDYLTLNSMYFNIDKIGDIYGGKNK